MQKKFIALAVAGLLSGVAFAQSNVTIYGTIDMAYVHQSKAVVAGEMPTTQLMTVVGIGRVLV